ncbi:hypothetical protein BZA05DRAFT_441223 [Tricharina praecox]|uniref:uncharacterized protein n=1 Tax=Tricharina praecox TaxID=43433 RepID=UPI00221E5EAC|nr:uncharacterized protein BZA05DRAFT_449574 [Tricharina praecox]XP_051343677.1 uncharacterized protein BZA05DRAFT_441223 [Tricharina praecox]KAI5841305.1 hypothetical protein BZA05DRAFT_449574 [Tricharina praecox]KAI5857931.1 hypothetical protein BZA05DRAFT_441223 [Tricharina praecox]
MNATPRLLGKILKAVGPKEPHPYFIYPKTAAAYPINPAFLSQRLGRTAGAYVPFMGVVFLWPFAAQYITTQTGGP